MAFIWNIPPPSQNDIYYFSEIGRALNHYTQKYEKLILAGDFNAEQKENVLNNFMDLYDLKCLVNEKTCFKSIQNPSCIDLFLTNCNRSFVSTTTISTGCSDFHKMVVTVFKINFKKSKPKKIPYCCFKNLDKEEFKAYLRSKVENCNSHESFEKHFLEVLNKYAPVKTKIKRANEVPYMTKALRKAIANRSRLENRYYRLKTEDSKISYKKQKNFCSRLYKKERKKFYENLDQKNITDPKKFWKTMTPFFSDKLCGSDIITLLENE